MVEVTMTMEKYLTLINGLNGNDIMISDRSLMQPEIDVPKSKKRKKTARDRAMKKAVREANERLRTKKGMLRKGKTQADVMRLANKLADEMMK